MSEINNAIRVKAAKAGRFVWASLIFRRAGPGPVWALAVTIPTFKPFAKRAEDIKDEIEHIEI